MDYKLTFEQHADGVCKKPVSGQSFNVDSTFIKMFYSCFIKLVFMFTFMCWFGSHSFRNKNLLQNIVKVHDTHKTRLLIKAPSFVISACCSRLATDTFCQNVRLTDIHQTFMHIFFV